MNLRIDLAYDGAPFHGFARQPGVRTVQGDIEAALSKLFKADVTTECAGRTDAGVHAIGQVMSTEEAPEECDPDAVTAALNGMCAPEIVVSGCRGVADDFHARFSARSRTYLYAIWSLPRPDPWLSKTTWHVRAPLDMSAMNEAAGHLVGSHDFGSFGRIPEGGSSERILYELRCSRAGDLVRIRARANAFIHQMVRSLVGTLVEVGTGRRSPNDMPAVLAARDRAAAGPVAPPQGLCLVAVEYDSGWSGPPTSGAPSNPVRSEGE